MQANKDIHNYAHTFERYKLKIEQDKKINVENKATLLEYAKSLRDFSPATGSKNIQVMHRVATMLPKPFKAATKKDIEVVVDSLRGNELTTWTLIKYQSILKKFYKWLYGLDEYPEVVKWIKPRRGKANGVPTNRLGLDDFEQLIQAARKPRDKFIIAALADLGCRISELGSMNLENVEDRGEYVLFQISESKTQVRSLPVKNCRPYLLDYLAVHPKAKQSSAPLLINGKGERMHYANIRKMILDTAAIAQISKPVNPHHFRRSTATLYGQCFRESELDTWFGWGTTKTSSIYVQFSGQQLLEAYNRFWESDKNTLRQITCKRCATLNAGVAQYCNKCYEPLLAKTVLSKQQAEAEKDKGLIEAALKDTEFGKSLINLLADFVEKRKLRKTCGGNQTNGFIK